MSAHLAEILVIGAGMAGLACAERLQQAGRKVMLLDKGRGPGGRMATRRVDLGLQQVSFDHGTQYVTAEDPRFAAELARWQAEGWAARWEAAGPHAVIGLPGMNGILRRIAEPLDVRWGVRADMVKRSAGRWHVNAGDAHYAAELLLVAIPAEQAAALLEQVAPAFASLAGGVSSAPCWAMMAAFAAPLAIGDDVLRNPSRDIAWAARNSAKPGRGGAEAWVIHASAQRTEALIDARREAVADALLADFFAAAGIAPEAALHCDAHRWLYAFPASLTGPAARFDGRAGLGVAGDWLVQPRVEGAWLSGTALAEAVLEGFKP